MKLDDIVNIKKTKLNNCGLTGFNYSFCVGRLTASLFPCRNSETSGATTSGVLRWTWWSPGTVTTVCWNTTQGRETHQQQQQIHAAQVIRTCRTVTLAHGCTLTFLSRRTWRSVEVNVVWDGSERLLSQPSCALGGMKHVMC